MALMATTQASGALLVYTLIHMANVVCAHNEDGVHSGYTFVIDDLVWLTFFILLVVLITWAYCAVFPAPEPEPCKRCTACPTRDHVIHVKIDQGCMPSAYKTRSRPPLTEPRPSAEGDHPSAPTLPEEVVYGSV